MDNREIYTLCVVDESLKQNQEKVHWKEHWNLFLKHTLTIKGVYISVSNKSKLGVSQVS